MDLLKHPVIYMSCLGPWTDVGAHQEYRYHSSVRKGLSIVDQPKETWGNLVQIEKRLSPGSCITFTLNVLYSTPYITLCIPVDQIRFHYSRIDDEGPMSPFEGLTRIQHGPLRGRDLRISKLDGQKAHDRSTEVINICSIFPSFALVYLPICPFCSSMVVLGRPSRRGC